jgi:hypothetical protein
MDIKPIKQAKMTITPKRNHDSFTDILHLLLMAHTQNPYEPFTKMVYKVTSFWGPWAGNFLDCPDDVVINGLENLLDDFKQLDNYQR